MRDYVDAVLRPLLQGDGGEMEFLDYDGNTVHVLLRGECSKCNIAERCLRWCEEKTKADTGKNVRFSAERKKPFFWDV